MHPRHDSLHGDHRGAPGEADCVVRDGVTVFDDAYPAVANLDPALLGALRQAATDAAGDGVKFYVGSGWRSRKYQEQLLDEAILKYGSKEEAARWVGTPTTSAHVSGGRGPHRALRCHGVAVRAWRRVRAVPDVPQRTLAPRTAPRSYRSRLPAHVRRPYERSKDAVTSTHGTEPMSTQSPHTGDNMCRKLRPLAALVMAAAIVAGCSNAPAETSTGNNTAATHEKAVKFANCMRVNGVKEFPDPDPSGTFTIEVVNGSSLDPSTAAWKKAISACKDLEPPGFTGGKRSPEQQKAALKFAECIRDNGVKDFPDPSPDGPIIDTERIPSSNTQAGMTILRAAMQKCGDYARDAGVTGGGNR